MSDATSMRTGFQTKAAGFLAVAGVLSAGVIVLLFLGLRAPVDRSPTFLITTIAVALQPVIFFGTLSARAMSPGTFVGGFLTQFVVTAYGLITLGTVAAFNAVLLRIGASARAYVTVLVAEALTALALWFLTRVLTAAKEAAARRAP